MLSLSYSFRLLTKFDARTARVNIKLLSTTEEVPTEVRNVETLSRGCVLVAQPEEYSHFLVKSVVLIFEHGKGETQGVILERPTAFTLGETAPGIGVFEG